MLPSNAIGFRVQLVRTLSLAMTPALPLTLTPTEWVRRAVLAVLAGLIWALFNPVAAEPGD